MSRTMMPTTACPGSIIVTHLFYTTLRAWLGWKCDQASGGIGMGHFIVECARIHHHIVSLNRESKAVQASRCRAIQKFPINIIVRPVTGALEAHAFITEWHGTAQMDAALVQGNPVAIALWIGDNILCIELVLKTCSQ